MGFELCRVAFEYQAGDGVIEEVRDCGGFRRLAKSLGLEVDFPAEDSACLCQIPREDLLKVLGALVFRTIGSSPITIRSM